ncbi:MAG: YceD family protein [Woeseiaceae bacterium]
MGNPLHQRRTPQEFAEEAQVTEISGKIGDFGRLAEIVEADISALEADKIPPAWRDRLVTGELRFQFLDAHSRLPALAGQLSATIDAVCQRCLAPFELPLATSLHLLFSGDNAVEKDGEEYEVWELEDEELLIAELVEEALIMTIPFVAMHEGDAECAAQDAPGESAEKMTLPFANLKQQMEQEN